MRWGAENASRNAVLQMWGGVGSASQRGACVEAQCWQGTMHAWGRMLATDDKSRCEWVSWGSGRRVPSLEVRAGTVSGSQATRRPPF